MSAVPGSSVDADRPQMTLRDLVVVVTRGGDPDDPLEQMLERAGARVVAWHTIATPEPTDPEPLERAVDTLDEYDWIACTSARAVQAMVQRGARPPERALVAAVGPGTARALASAGWSVAVVGSGGAEAMVRTWADAYPLEGARVLFPAASGAGSALSDALTTRGARIERVEAYRTLIVPPEPARVLDDLRRGVDVVTFASPSAVASLAASLGDLWPGVLDCGIAAIGPTTYDELVALAVKPDRIHVADPPGFEGLVQAVALVHASRGGGMVPEDARSGGRDA